MVETRKFSYQTIRNTSYIVVACEVGELINYQVQMLTDAENQKMMKYILPVTKFWKDEKVELYYNITSKVSLAHILERKKLSKTEFLTLIDAILRACEEAEDFQFVDSGFEFEAEAIFIKPDTFEVSFLYLPVKDQNHEKDGVRHIIQNFILRGMVETSTDNFVQILLNSVAEDSYSRDALKKCVLQLQKGEMSAEKTTIQTEKKSIPVLEPTISPKSETEEIKNVVPHVQADKIYKNPEQKMRSENKKELKIKGNKSKIKMIAVQAAVAVVLAGCVFLNFFTDPEGNFQMNNAVAFVLLLLLVEFFAYRRLIANKKGESEKKSMKKERNESKEKNRRSSATKDIQIPGVEKAFVATKEKEAIFSTEAETMPEQNDKATICIVQPNRMETDETVVVEEMKEAYLEYYADGTIVQIWLNKKSFILGRLESQVDYALVGKDKVGRVHAEIREKEGSYYLVDLNSKNGTYLNGSKERITSNLEYKLNYGDRITLANVDFTFRCQ